MSMNRLNFFFASYVLAGALDAQQATWMTSSPVGYPTNLSNNQMPMQTLASAPGRLVAARWLYLQGAGDTEYYGAVMLEAIDPATGSTLVSCPLMDTVEVTAIAVDPAGIAYIAGGFKGAVLELCDGSQLPGKDPSELTGINGENHFLLAWDLSSGAPLWVRNISMSRPSCYLIPSLALDPQGRPWYLVNESGGMGYLVRVDVSGNDVEAREIGSDIFGLSTLSFDPWGGAYVSGACGAGMFTFGGQDFPVESGYNTFLLRYKPDGSAGFVEFMTEGTGQNRTVVASADGYAYLAGMEAFGHDLFLLKVDSMGQFQWGLESQPMSGIFSPHYINRANGPCITLDADNNVYLIASVLGVVDWGNGVFSYGQDVTTARRSLTVVAFDPSGIPQWAVTSGPSSWNVWGGGTATAMAEPGSVHFITHAADSLSMGPLTAGGEGLSVIWGRISEFATGQESAVDAPGLQNWPNPTSDVLFVEWPGSTVISGALLNSAGQLVERIDLAPGRNAVDVQGLPAGLYLLRLVDGSATRVIVE